MDSAQPLVTIILPTFNRWKCLPAAIRSIVAQEFRDWRLLVVNDGGEDVSDVVASFGDSRIEWHDRPHLGKAAALNFGLSLVRSRYVAYMDDDDIVYPDHLAELVSLAEKENAEFVYSDTWAVYLDPDGREIRRRPENEEDVSFEDIRLFNRINHKQILHTKRLADEAGPYDERLCILIDYDYIRRLARVCRPVHLRKITGEHFLRQSAAGEGMDPASITGLWASDPEACGRSVAALFEKDPAAIAALYREAIRFRAEARRHGKTREALEKTCEMLEKTRETLDKTRDALGKNREALGKTRETLEKTRAALEKTRAALEKTREAREKTRETLEKTRAALEKTRETLKKRTARLKAVEASPSYRFARRLASLLRLPRSLFRRH